MDEPPGLAALTHSPGFFLARHALIQFGLLVLLLSLFAAADSWQHITGWNLAAGLAWVTGLLAGFAVTSVLHEWFHWLGGKLSGGAYSIPEKPGLFVFDWDFENNSVRQFFTMSIGGNLGGVLALASLAAAVTTDTAGRSALVAGAVASVAFAAIIEWPVLWRTRTSGNPVQELSKIGPEVLKRAALGGMGAGLLGWYLIC